MNVSIICRYSPHFHYTPTIPSLGNGYVWPFSKLQIHYFCGTQIRSIKRNVFTKYCCTRWGLYEDCVHIGKIIYCMYFKGVKKCMFKYVLYRLRTHGLMKPSVYSTISPKQPQLEPAFHYLAIAITNVKNTWRPPHVTNSSAFSFQMWPNTS